MNKIIIIGVLVASFTIISCSNNNSVTSTDDPELSGEGGVAFTFTSSNQAKGLNGVRYKTANDSFPDPTNVRVVVRRYETNQYGSHELKFNTLGDVEVPTDTTLIITVPEGINYRIDAFSYVDSLSYFKYLLKYQVVDSINVVADSVTNVSLTLEPIKPEFILPDSVEKGDEFTIGANFKTFGEAPNNQYSPYIWSDTLFDNSLHDNMQNPVHGQIHNPEYSVEWSYSESEFEGRDVYFKSLFSYYLKDYYKSSENTGSFLFIYPNPFIVNDTTKVFVKSPAGGIGVNVTY